MTQKFTWILVSLAGMALAFLGGLVQADLTHSRSVSAADPYPAAVMASQTAEITRLKATLDQTRMDLVRAQSVAQTADARAQTASRGFEAMSSAASDSERTQRQTVADLRQQVAAWQKSAEENHRIAEANFASAESWKQAALSQSPAPQVSQSPSLPVSYVPTTLDTLAQEQRRRDEQQQAYDQRKAEAQAKRPTQIISTGYGTATVIGPDGKHSFIQSTGEGTGMITTP